MTLALVMAEQHARRAVKLRDHDTLRTIDDEAAGRSHQGNVSKEDFLLLDQLDLVCFATVNDEPNCHVQWCGIRRASRNTVLYIKRRLIDSVVDVFQVSSLGCIFNGENRLKSGVQTNLLSIIGRNVCLEELAVRVSLDCQEIVQFYWIRKTTEVLSNTFFLSE